jgi:hypothetical protein
MVAPVTLDSLITHVRAVAPDEPLSQLEEAARLRDEVGELTDALLGHFVDQARRGGSSWSQIGDALGVSKQAAQQKHTSRSLPTERLTERTRVALEQGVEAAKRLGRAQVDTEHVLLGLLAVPDSIAARVLVGHGLTTDFVEGALGQWQQPGSDEPVPTLPGYSAVAARVVTGALEQALTMGHNYIGTEHVLLSLLAEPEGGARALLDDAEVTLTGVRAEVVSLLAGMV